jgi:hypothetical protein
MKNSIFYITLINLVFVTACTSIHKKSSDVLSFAQLNNVDLGLSQDQIQSTLGRTYQYDPPSEKMNTYGWIYYGENDQPWQRAAISFDTKNHRVVSKTFIPFENENENDINFLLENKYPDLKFEKIPLERCDRDFIPSEIFYINLAMGIIIKFNGNDKSVESITWTSSENAQLKIKKIKSCEN